MLILRPQFKTTIDESIENNMMRFSFAFILLCTCFFAAQAQDDATLFTVNGEPVKVSEFKYIYEKTNGDKATYDQASLDEHLDLYQKFKLKVQRARTLKLDTLPRLQRELAGYYKQLSQSYLVDKEVTERLVKEVFERQKEDVEVSHIMMKLSPRATPADTLAAYNKLLDLKKQIEGGASFSDLAAQNSQDNSAKKNGGNIGFLTSMLPRGFYEMENAIYTLKPGEVGGPVRTKAGFHLIKVESKRPARGKVEVAHILIRKSDKVSSEQAKAKADSLFSLLPKQDFGTLAKSHSEDDKTALKGGALPVFGINKYQRTFEDQAFALAKDGDYSKPFETSSGWHIMKRISKPTIGEYNLARRRLQTKVQNSDRYVLAKTAMVNKIKKEGQYQLNKENWSNYLDSLDRSFVTNEWNEPKMDENTPVFSMKGGYNVTVGDFNQFARKNGRDRMRGGTRTKPADVAQGMYDKFLEAQLLKYEEGQLAEKYPEYAALKREYEEGILLFEVTTQEVWDKAAEDSTGLANYYEKNKAKYQWEKRARVTEYTVRTTDIKEVSKIRKFVQKHTPEEAKEKFNTDDKRTLSAKEFRLEKGRDDEVDRLNFQVGATTSPEQNVRAKTYKFKKIEEVLPAGQKTLKEARGSVISDYQAQLESEWISSLRKTYPIEVDQDVYKKLVQ